MSAAAGVKPGSARRGHTGPFERELVSSLSPQVATTSALLMHSTPQLWSVCSVYSERPKLTDRSKTTSYGKFCLSSRSTRTLSSTRS